MRFQPVLNYFIPNEDNSGNTTHTGDISHHISGQKSLNGKRRCVGGHFATASCDSAVGEGQFRRWCHVIVKASLLPHCRGNNDSNYGAGGWKSAMHILTLPTRVSLEKHTQQGKTLSCVFLSVKPKLTHRHAHVYTLSRPGENSFKHTYTHTDCRSYFLSALTTSHTKHRLLCRTHAPQSLCTTFKPSLSFHIDFFFSRVQGSHARQGQ